MHPGFTLVRTWFGKQEKSLALKDSFAGSVLAKDHGQKMIGGATVQSDWLMNRCKPFRSTGIIKAMQTRRLVEVTRSEL